LTLHYDRNSFTKLDLEAALDRLTLRMMVRFDVMLVAGLGALAAVLKLA
jgi:hypothetical protein